MANYSFLTEVQSTPFDTETPDDLRINVVEVNDEGPVIVAFRADGDPIDLKSEYLSYYLIRKLMLITTVFNKGDIYYVRITHRDTLN